MGGGVHGEGPKVVESHCLSAAGALRPVRCVGVADVLSQVSQVSHIRNVDHQSYFSKFNITLSKLEETFTILN